MGVVVSKRPYKSVCTSDSSDDFSSINMSYNSTYGMSTVHEKGVHRQHFSRLLKPTSTRGVAVARNAKQVSETA